MRSLLIIVSTVFLLAVGFLIYFWMQSPIKPLSPAQTHNLPQMPETLHEPAAIVGDVESAWLQTFDPKTAKVAWQFRSSRADPRRDGRVSVKDPEAEFFLRDDQKLCVHGRDGVITPSRLPSKGGQGFGARQNAGPPTRGELEDVVVTLVDLHDPPTADPILTVTMNNASFDNETFKIYTEGYSDRRGGIVPADQVPVHMVGRDYDFDGQGLTIRWNDRDHILELLEIAHGERLVLKHPGKRFAGTGTAIGRGTDAPSVAAPIAVAYPTWIRPDRTIRAGNPAGLLDLSSQSRLITVGRGDPSQEPADNASAPDIRPSRSLSGPSLYTATFHDNVQIERGIQTHINSNILRVDFPMESEPTAAAPATAPTSAPSTDVRTPKDRTREADRGKSNTSGDARADHLAATMPASTAPAGEAAAAPTTSPADIAEVPVIVTWTGLLRVEPLKGAVAMPPGESMVSLYGTPVVALQGTSELRAGVVTYETVSKEVNAQPDKDGHFPVALKTSDARGESNIDTERLKVTESGGAEHVAQLRGRGKASLPAQANGNAMLKADWSQGGTFYFADTGDGHSEIDHARLDGAVHVDHPQIDLKSDFLTLDFQTNGKGSATRPATQNASDAAAIAIAAPSSRPTTQPDMATGQSSLKQLEAEGNVKCVMSDGPNKRLLDCDRLNVLTTPTPDGRFVPHIVHADGNVHAVDPDQDLHAGHLAVTLTTKPSTQPIRQAASTEPGQAAVAVHTPVTRPSTSPANPGGDLAVQSVVAHDNVVVVLTKNGTIATADQLLVNTLNGHPNLKLLGQPATLLSKRSKLSCGVISVSPDDQQLSADGIGEMHGEQEDSAGSNPRPLDVSWVSNLHVDGKGNVVDATGNVSAVTTDADGTLNQMKGDRVTLILADAPATQPATKPSTAPASASTGDNMDVMGHKMVKQAIFRDNAEAHSVLLGPDNVVLRRIELYAPTIQFDMVPRPTSQPVTMPAPATGAVATTMSATQPSLMLRRLTVPCAGRMMVENHPATQPAATQAGATQPAGTLATTLPAKNETKTSADASNRGDNAFEWSRSMIYDDATHQMKMEGDVYIVHVEEGKNDVVTLKHADLVTADLVAAPAPSSSTTAPASASHITISKITAAGNVHLLGHNGDLTATRLEYNPLTHIVTAFGSGNSPAVFSRAASTPHGYTPMSADEIRWDTQSDLPTLIHPHGQFPH